MKRLLIWIILLLPEDSHAQNWKSFNQDGILFTATYPVSWENKIKENKRVFFTSPMENPADDFRENINISVTQNAGFGTTIQVKNIVQRIIDEVSKSYYEFQEEKRSFLQWNGMDAAEITYTGIPKSDSNLSIRIVQRFCFNQTRLYMLTYTALKSNDNFTKTAMQIINSIKFKE